MPRRQESIDHHLMLCWRRVGAAGDDWAPYLEEVEEELERGICSNEQLIDTSLNQLETSNLCLKEEN